MKPGTTIFLLTILLFATTISVAAPRTVLYESWENWNTNFADWNRLTWQALAAMGTDTVISIRYHVWWPTNNDAFYLWNPTETRIRTQFYNIQYFPDGYTDGASHLPTPRSLEGLLSQIRTAYATPAPCTMGLSASQSTGNTVDFNGTIQAEQDMTDPNLRLYVVLISDSVRYSVAPGANGETFFPAPFRDLWPDSSGQSVTIGAGGSFNFQGALNKDPSWYPNQLSAIAFVQNISTHEVLQATSVSVAGNCISEPNTQCTAQGGTIPDGDATGISYPVQVSLQYQITAVRVRLDILHNEDSDLTVALHSPAGTSAVLTSHEGAGGHNFTCTTFSDAAFEPINAGTPPFNGSFRPEQALSVFNGENMEGTWMIHVVDDIAGTAGSLNWACISFDVAPTNAPIGDTYLAGTTWYDLQHNGSAGKMIGVDNAGYVHLVWMKGMDANNSQRHVYYNVWNPNSQQMLFTDGVQIDSSSRAGFVCQTVTPGGWPFPALHIQTAAPGLHTTVAMDSLPYHGLFAQTQPAFLYENGTPLQLLWPKIAADRDSVLHVVSTEYLVSGSGRNFYSRGNPQWGQYGQRLGITWQTVGPGGAQFMAVDTVSSVSSDIACSKISNRVAIAFTRLRPGAYVANSLNSDLYLTVSEDGGVNWGPPTNLTQFTAVDSQRAFSDVSLVFDEQDVLHLAFTTSNFWESPDFNSGISTFRSRIWHWNDATRTFSAIASDWTEGLYPPGTGLLNVCRPSLSIDPSSGYVYCSYQKFDQAYWSWTEHANADAWVTVSADDGHHWSVGRNVTNSHSVVNPAAAGESRSERDITMADRVTYVGSVGYLHLEWELDLDAGSWPYNEGAAENNPFYYQRIAVDDIPLSPLIAGESLHDGAPQPVTNLVVLVNPETLSYSLHWTGVPGANQYGVYHSSSVSNVFDAGNFVTDVTDTTYQCIGCLSSPALVGFFGVVSKNVAARAERRGTSIPLSVQPPSW